MLSRPAIVDRPLRTRAAVSNGTRMHAKSVDGRSAEARRFKDLVSSFAASLGGEGALTEAERTLIRNAASLTVQCERLQAAHVAGHEVNSQEMTRLANSSARVLAALMIKRERKEAAPTLSAGAGRPLSRPPCGREPEWGVARTRQRDAATEEISLSSAS
jgi:hypothetical protein